MKTIGATLSTKLLLIFIGALVLLGALAWGFSKPWRGPWRDQMPKVMWVNLRAHLIAVSERIGNPPTEEKARKVLSELRLELLLRQGETTLFSTATRLPRLTDIQHEIEDETRYRDSRPKSLRAKLGDFIVGRTDGRPFAVLAKDGRQYIYFLPEQEAFQAGLRAFRGFAFGIAFLLALILLTTNRLLRPMKPLMKGVGELSKGNLDYRVSIQPRGEFRRVAEAFNAMAEALQRQLKSKDQLLMDVSHELRSPMGRIKMAAEMLPSDLLTGAKSELKAQIQADVREMEELVSELLELYRLRDSAQRVQTTLPGVSQEIDLTTLLLEVTGTFASQKPGITFVTPSAAVMIKGDAKQLKRAIRNIVENAVKFSREQTRPVEVSLKVEPDWYVIEVQDHGIGMTEAQRAHIFEPFFRADSSRVRETGGFGLGLPMAQAIVKAHGGSIECRADAKLDGGCAFRIVLPKA